MNKYNDNKNVALVFFMSNIIHNRKILDLVEILWPVQTEMLLNNRYTHTQNYLYADLLFT